MKVFKKNKIISSIASAFAFLSLISFAVQPVAAKSDGSRGRGIGSIDHSGSSLSSNIISVPSLENSLTQLNNAKTDSSLSTSDKTYSEVTARENIVSVVLNLSLNEVSSTQAEMNSLPSFATSTREYALQQEYLNQLNDFNNYFYGEWQKLNDIETSYDQYSPSTNKTLKKLAAEIADYREHYYDQRIGSMLNFYLVYYSESMIFTANSQLNAVSTNINQLEAGNYITQGEFDQQLNEINTLLQSAADLTAAAKEMILYPESLSATSTSSAGLSPTGSVSGTPATATPSDLITQSLSDIKQAYGLFLGIGAQLKNIL